MTCKDCIHSGLCYKENDYENFPDICGSFIPERQQGEWKIIEHETQYLMGIYQCNLCSYKYTCPDEFARNFCPNCGADMRGDNNDNKV